MNKFELPTITTVAYTGACDLPTPWANFRLHGFVDQADGKEHVALTLGAITDGEPVLARVHSECLTGDAFFSQRCDCGSQLEEAMKRILVVETGAGRVHVVGMDFSWRDRAENMKRVCDSHPRLPGTTRIVMLHDPGAFKHLPDGEADLVLSGHTHGGQIGLVSLGFSWTVLRLFGITLPDHGFWARGRDRMYVHRGTGHYGFPLRIGVPSEESVLSVHRAGSTR